MKKKLWRALFSSSSVPKFPCPKCGEGVLVLNKGKLHQERPAYVTLADFEESPEMAPERFVMLLNCAERLCGEVVAVLLLVEMAKNTAPEGKKPIGAPSFTDEQIAGFKSKMLELVPQGWTVRQVLAEPDMCSMTYFFAVLLPADEGFQKQYARAMEQRNEFWAEKLVEISDEAKNDWMTRTYGDTEIDMPNPEVVARSKLGIETRKWLMGKSL
jgi:hypothetical protein